MKSFDELESQHLRWVQKSNIFRYDWELQAENGEVIASMRQKSLWLYQFELDAVGQRWEFENKGIFFSRRIEIRSVGTGDLVATYHSFRKQLKFVSGEQFYWRQSSLWGMKHGWVNDYDQPVVGFKAEGFLKWESDVTIHPDTNATKSPPLLVLFGWYLMVIDSTTG